MIRFLLVLCLLLPFSALAEESPQVWGYGVKSCDDYIRAYQGWEDGVDEQIAQYLHHRDWLAGFVSGLSMATNSDVLRGVELSAAMRRIHLHCDENLEDDFFTASLAFIRMLSQLESIQDLAGEKDKTP